MQKEIENNFNHNLFFIFLNYFIEYLLRFRATDDKLKYNTIFRLIQNENTSS
jgi:hypothetical protein